MKRRDFIALAGAACFNIGHAATLLRIVGKGRRLRLALTAYGLRPSTWRQVRSAR